MIFRQLFDASSGTYSYILASRRGGEALIIDPVLEKVDQYLRLLADLELSLVMAVDTHLHADHRTGLGDLRDKTRCITVMGEQSKADVVAVRVADGDNIKVDGISLGVVYTPGHTDDSYSFTMADRVFTGDTLLIRGTGRTDFQNGDASAQYDSIFGRLLKLPDDTLVYPAHDYKGETVSTIGEERAHNPRLQVASREAYAELMANLNLPNPKLMDVVVPFNAAIGFPQRGDDQADSIVHARDLVLRLGDPAMLLVDLREDWERRKHGSLPGSVHLPYRRLEAALSHVGSLAAVAEMRELVFYCQHGERSAMAARRAREAGHRSSRHLIHGLGFLTDTEGEQALRETAAWHSVDFSAGQSQCKTTS